MNYINWKTYQNLIVNNRIVTETPLESDKGLFISQFKSDFSNELIQKGELINYMAKDGLYMSRAKFSIPEVCQIENFYQEDCISFVFCLGGKVKTVNTTTEMNTLNKGDFTFYKLEKGLHVLEIIPTNDDYEVIAIHFSLETFENVLGKRIDRLPNSLKEVCYSSIKAFYKIEPMPHELFIRLKSIHFDIIEGLDYQLYIESKIYELISYGIQQFSTKEDDKIKFRRKEQKLLLDLCDEIKNNMTKLPCLFSLSNKYDMTETEIYELFKNELNTTPKKFLQEYRLLKAKELLKEGTENVCSTAYKVGYSSVSSFSKAFMKKFSARPGAFYHKNPKEHLFLFDEHFDSFLIVLFSKTISTGQRKTTLIH